MARLEQPEALANRRGKTLVLLGWDVPPLVLPVLNRDYNRGY